MIVPSPRVIVLSLATAIAPVFLSGCATSTTVEVENKCEYGEDVERKCEFTIGISISSGKFNNINQIINENVALDFNNSQRPLNDSPYNSARPGIITLKNNGVTVGVESSTYMKVGQKVVSENPSNLTSTLALYNGQVDEIELVVEQLSFTLQPGPNTITSEVTHDTNVLAGASTAIYYEPPCGGSGDPSTTPGDDTIFC